MKNPRSILLLSGSAEARQIASALVAKGMQVRALKSEPPRGSNPMPVPYEVVDPLSVEAIQSAIAQADLVVDASHGFDGAMTQAGFTAAQRAGVPFVSFQRPCWDVAEHPKWHVAVNVTAAMALISPRARVFCATGWASLPEYAGFPGARLMLRQTTRHDRPPPYPFVELVFGDPPFTVAQERALFQKRHVDTLICRNLGGTPSRPKLDAAKALDVTVILVERPPLPPGITVFDAVEDILAWVDRQ